MTDLLTDGLRSLRHQAPGMYATVYLHPNGKVHLELFAPGKPTRAYDCSLDPEDDSPTPGEVVARWMGER